MFRNRVPVVYTVVNWQTKATVKKNPSSKTYKWFPLILHSLHYRKYFVIMLCWCCNIWKNKSQMPLCYTNLYLYIQFPFQPAFRVVWVYNIETSFTYILFRENMPLCHKAQIWPDIYCDACKTLSDFLLRMMLHELGNTCCVISCCLFEI